MQLNGSGKDYRKVSEVMGHHSTEFTEKQYGHTIEADEKHEATRSVTDSFLQ
jgi:integrase